MAYLDNSGRHDASRVREYLTFRIGTEEYGIDILKVQEIRGYEQPTRIAHAPGFVKGVVNLRGTIAPIIDLRLCFGCSSVEYNDLTVSVILHVQHRTVGMVVDSVSDVMELPEDAIKPAPHIQCTIDSNFVTGLGQLGERMVILLDIERLITSPQFGLVETALAA